MRHVRAIVQCAWGAKYQVLCSLLKVAGDGRRTKAMSKSMFLLSALYCGWLYRLVDWKLWRALSNVCETSSAPRYTVTLLALKCAIHNKSH